MAHEMTDEEREADERRARKNRELLDSIRRRNRERASIPMNNTPLPPVNDHGPSSSCDTSSSSSSCDSGSF